METSVPSYLTSPAEALRRATNLENQILTAADGALATFLARVVEDAKDGSITSGAVTGYWRAGMEQALSHPAFVDVRPDILQELESSVFADDVYTAATMALATAHNESATFAERDSLLEALFAHPDPSTLVASLSAKVDSWLRRRVSRYMLRDLGQEGRDALSSPHFPEYPLAPHKTGTLVTEANWERDDRPGEINWRARMQRDIRTTYTNVFGRQMQHQLEKHSFAEKGWVSHHDERTRHTHLAADGQWVPLHAAFEVGTSRLRYPGDPLGPPGETFNCRCVMIGRDGS